MGETVPDIFREGIDYKDDAETLELAQGTFNEEALYRALTSFGAEWFRSRDRMPKVLDLCSASGFAALRLVREIPARSVTLVDADAEALKRGTAHLAGLCPVSTYCADAVTFSIGGPYDIILMNSAYHHIENGKKIAFLMSAARILSRDGVILVGEHFLPPYRDVIEYRKNVISFYSRLLDELTRRSEPSDAVNVIRKSGLYCWQGIYEYKVSMDRFFADMEKARLKIIQSEAVWVVRVGNDSMEPPNAGSFALMLGPRRPNAELPE